MRGSKYTLIFATVVSICLSVMLSGVFMVLKDRQDENRALDQQKNILEAAQIMAQSNDEIKRFFDAQVEPMVINKYGEIFADKSEEDVSEKTPELLVLYKIKNSDGTLKGYVYPVVGTGLWSKLYGYLAVDSIGKKVLGLTFYKQGETPGLGADIEKKWFRDNFVGKDLFDGNSLVGVRVTKGPATLDPDYKSAKNSLVDGISGATITGDGVSAMMKKYPNLYEPFFEKLRAN